MGSACTRHLASYILMFAFSVTLPVRAGLLTFCSNSSCPGLETVVSADDCEGCPKDRKSPGSEAGTLGTSDCCIEISSDSPAVTSEYAKLSNVQPLLHLVDFSLITPVIPPVQRDNLRAFLVVRTAPPDLPSFVVLQI